MAALRNQEPVERVAVMVGEIEHLENMTCVDGEHPRATLDVGPEADAARQEARAPQGGSSPPVCRM